MKEKKNNLKIKKKQIGKINSPIIPNTQMMIFKFNNTDKKCEWNVDLIVQRME